MFKYILNNNANVFCDNFYTRTTGAWDEIKDYPNLFILPNGDKCNHLISTADIFLRFLDYQLKSRNGYWLEEIEKALNLTLGEKLYIHTISNKHYSDITPLDARDIDLNSMHVHPIYYLMLPSPRSLKLDVILQNCPNLMNEVCSKGGSICAFNGNAPMQYLETNDVLITFDERGENDAKILMKMGKKLKIKSISDYV